MMPPLVAKNDYDDPIMTNVFVHEGGYGWDRADPGGPTKYGITYIDLAEYEHQDPGSPDQWASRVESMPKSTADLIYKNKYAAGIMFDNLVKGPDYVLLDYGINSGVSRAVRVAQTLLNLPVTGRMGPNVVDAINKSPPDWFVDAVSAERLAFLKSLRTWRTFGSGWGKRVRDVQSISHQLADGKITSKPTAGNVGQKGVHTPHPTTQKTISGGTGLGAAIVALLASSQLPLWLALGIGAAILAGGIIVWIQYHKQVAAKNETVILPPGVVPRPAPARV
jgi:lysozyme family protein